MLMACRVLIVDDVADTRELTKDVLGAHGALVRTAACAAEALALLESDVFDVLVSDIGMPEMDGYMLIAEIRRRGRSAAILPAIALTAFASAVDRQRALDAGFQAHVAKPHIVGELVSKLAQVLVKKDALAR
jgi:CheY-like chemotaxis protein